MLSKQRKTRKEINVCLNCGSIDMKSIFLMNPQEQTFFNTNNKMIMASPGNQDFFGCLNCSYCGISPKVNKNDLKKFKAEIKKRGPLNLEAQGVNKNQRAVKWTSIFTLIGTLTIFVSLFFIDTIIGNALFIASIVATVIVIAIYIRAYLNLRSQLPIIQKN